MYELKVRYGRGGLTLIKLDALYYPDITEFLIESCGLPRSTALNFCFVLQDNGGLIDIDGIRMRTDAILGGAVITLTRKLVIIDYVDN